MTVTDQGPEPRPASAKRIMAVKKARGRSEIQMQTAAAADAAAADARGDCGRGRETRRGPCGQGLLIKQWTLDDIKADLAWCGKDGSPTKVKRIQSVVLKGSGFKKVEPNAKGLTEMVHALIEDHTIGLTC